MCTTTLHKIRIVSVFRKYIRGNCLKTIKFNITTNKSTNNRRSCQICRSKLIICMVCRCPYELSQHPVGGLQFPLVPHHPHPSSAPQLLSHCLIERKAPRTANRASTNNWSNNSLAQYATRNTNLISTPTRNHIIRLRL